MTELPLCLAAFLACFALDPDAEPIAPQVIEIEVAPKDLARCRETVGQVMQAPIRQAPSGTVQSDASFGSVICVAKT